MRRGLVCLATGVLAVCFTACSSASNGSAGGPGVDAAPASVRVIRGDPNETMWFSLTIDGHGLTNDEGKLVTARIGVPERPPERLGSGQARIQDGAFRIEFPGGCEISLYKRKVLFVDADGDGICTPGVDRIYSDSRAPESDLTITLSDSIPKPQVDLQMLLQAADAATSNCQALNQPWPDS